MSPPQIKLLSCLLLPNSWTMGLDLVQVLLLVASTQTLQPEGWNSNSECPNEVRVVVAVLSGNQLKGAHEAHPMVLQATAILINISRDNNQRSLALRYIEYRRQKCWHLIQTYNFQYFQICKHKGISVQIFHGAISWNVGAWCFHNIRQVCVIHSPLQPTDCTVTQTVKKDKVMLLASYMRYPRYPVSVSVLPKLCWVLTLLFTSRIWSTWHCQYCQPAHV